MSTFTITYLDDPEAQAFFVSSNDRIVESFDTLAEAEAYVYYRMECELGSFWLFTAPAAE